MLKTELTVQKHLTVLNAYMLSNNLLTGQVKHHIAKNREKCSIIPQTLRPFYQQLINSATRKSVKDIGKLDLSDIYKILYLAVADGMFSRSQ